ncbi:hypothetical protein SAMN05444344_2031 [Tenacibaculum mesophilum]|uniref:Uncharacterized protein n=1 Tax=Tenacibaculum mesophilum TaxID=104268 RepID=A0ABM7CCS6_9FLAO|nr:hypothetical protein [Tenacibaculum mesophilum]AZJ31552.1 hypothetical protein D6200_02775 [Tenacibaculum mesophilum]QFS29601.1 hypothetical protein F9Y86_14770 [Tenacibaculum mesophilum]GFD81970.1 hypothetical protein KUL118_48320 [Tenacibaculum sp. KUL118]SHF93751.1 hypothetical protein SAMN05444344_2031 [Tenacibaculum mesophilum]
MFKNLGFQEYLSVGYIFLIALGLVSDTIFYRYLDIDYLQYITITDTLLSPISLLANNWALSVILIVFSMSLYFLIKNSVKIEEILKRVKWLKKRIEANKKAKRKEYDNKSAFIVSVFIMVFSLLLGFRLGMGINYKKRLAEGRLKNNITLVFKDDSQLKAKKIGQNSAYIFYVEEGNTFVTVTPILENIKQIKTIQKEE